MPAAGTVINEWQRLRDMAEAGDVDGLIRELDNPESEEAGPDRRVTVRQRAVFLLGKLREQRAAKPIEHLLQDSVPAVRAFSAWALGQIGSESSIKAVIAALDDPDVDVRRHAVSSLGEFESCKVVPPLLTELESSDPWTRLGAAKSLAKTGDPEALGPMRNAARREGLRHPTIRFRIIKSYFALKRKGGA